MAEPRVSEALFALAGALFGGLGVELLRRWLGRRDAIEEAQAQLRIRELKAAADLRDDLFEQVRQLWVRIGQLEQRLEAERERYAGLRAQYDELQQRYLALQVEVEQLRRQLDRGAL